MAVFEVPSRGSTEFKNNLPRLVAVFQKTVALNPMRYTIGPRARGYLQLRAPRPFLKALWGHLGAARKFGKNLFERLFLLVAQAWLTTDRRPKCRNFKRVVVTSCDRTTYCFAEGTGLKKSPAAANLPCPCAPAPSCKSLKRGFKPEREMRQQTACLQFAWEDQEGARLSQGRRKRCACLLMFQREGKRVSRNW